MWGLCAAWAITEARAQELIYTSVISALIVNRTVHYSKKPWGKKDLKEFVFSFSWIYNMKKSLKGKALNFTQGKFYSDLDFFNVIFYPCNIHLLQQWQGDCKIRCYFYITFWFQCYYQLLECGTNMLLYMHCIKDIAFTQNHRMIKVGNSFTPVN